MIYCAYNIWLTKSLGYEGQGWVFQMRFTKQKDQFELIIVLIINYLKINIPVDVKSPMKCTFNKEKLF